MAKSVKQTENAVLFHRTSGKQIFVVSVAADGSAITATTPVAGRKKVLVDTVGWSADRTVYNIDDCYTPDITTVDGILQYLAGHAALPVKPRAGYDSFVNPNGPTNPESPLRFSPAGTMRIVLVYLRAMYLKVAKGGVVGAEAAKLLSMLPLYAEVAEIDAHEALVALEKQKFADTARAMNLQPADLQLALDAKRARDAAAAAAAAAANTGEATDEEVEVEEVA